MKNLMIIVAVVISLNANAQLLKESGEYVYHKTVRQPASQEAIYAGVIEWANNEYNGNSGSIKSYSAEKGHVVIQGRLEHTVHGIPRSIQYELIIDIKRSMYRTIYKDFTYRGKEGIQQPFESNKLSGKKHIIQFTGEKIDAISRELKEFVAGDIVATK
ncbi:MAG: DUF4468 domain-containing protein [Reichenbachiella sp.]